MQWQSLPTENLSGQGVGVVAAGLEGLVTEGVVEAPGVVEGKVSPA